MSQEFKEPLPLILDWLAEPFDPHQVEWLPLDSANGTAIAAPYADSRAYADRLTTIFGVGGWQEEYHVQISGGGSYLKWVRGPEPQGGSVQKEMAYPGKAMVVCVLTIYGVGCHRGTGEKELHDGNALTYADSQSFRRACSKFELGRYFYDFPRSRAKVSNRKFVETPQVPAWATPRRKCLGNLIEGCTQIISPVQLHDGWMTSLAVAVGSHRAYGKELCVACSRHAKTNGMPQG